MLNNGPQNTPEETSLIDAAALNEAQTLEYLLTNPNTQFNNQCIEHAFYNAVWTNSADAVKKLLQHRGHDLLYTSKESGLVDAVTRGYQDTVETLLKHSDANNISVVGSALIWTAQTGNTRMAEILLEFNKGKSINLRDKELALTFAANNGHADTVIAIYELAGHKISQLHLGDTLKQAAANGQIAIVEALLTQGGTHIKPYIGSAFLAAVRNGHVAITEKLLAEKHSAKEMGHLIQGFEKGGALVTAIEKEYTTIVEKLLESRFPPAAVAPAREIRQSVLKWRIEDRKLWAAVDAANAKRHKEQQPGQTITPLPDSLLAPKEWMAREAAQEAAGNQYLDLSKIVDVPFYIPVTYMDDALEKATQKGDEHLVNLISDKPVAAAIPPALPVAAAITPALQQQRVKNSRARPPEGNAEKKRPSKKRK